MVYNKDSKLNKRSYLQMGIVKRYKGSVHNHLVLNSAHLGIWCPREPRKQNETWVDYFPVYRGEVLLKVTVLVIKMFNEFAG